MNSYADEVYELEHFCSFTKRLYVILNAKYEQADLNKDI